MPDPLESIVEHALARAEPTDPPAPLMRLVRARRRDTIIRASALAAIVLAPTLAIALALHATAPSPVTPEYPSDTIAVHPAGNDQPEPDTSDDLSRHTVAALRDRDPSLQRNDFPVARTPPRAPREIERAMSPGQIDRLLAGRE